MAGVGRTTCVGGEVPVHLGEKGISPPTTSRFPMVHRSWNYPIECLNFKTFMAYIRVVGFPNCENVEFPNSFYIGSLWSEQSTAPIALHGFSALIKPIPCVVNRTWSPPRHCIAKGRGIHLRCLQQRAAFKLLLPFAICVADSRAGLRELRFVQLPANITGCDPQTILKIWCAHGHLNHGWCIPFFIHARCKKYICLTRNMR